MADGQKTKKLSAEIFLYTATAATRTRVAPFHTTRSRATSPSQTSRCLFSIYIPHQGARWDDFFSAKGVRTRQDSLGRADPPPGVVHRASSISSLAMANLWLYSSKKALNVESPSFTPSVLQPINKKPTFSSQAVTAPSFTPRGLGGKKRPSRYQFDLMLITSFLFPQLLHHLLYQIPTYQCLILPLSENLHPVLISVLL